VTLLLLTVATVLLVSAFCSLSEAALYAVRLPYVRGLAESGSRAGRVLQHFKEHMGRPITAILVVNTVSNTAGAAVAGALAAVVFGERGPPIVIFSAVFTLAVLFLAEIIPKIVGIAHARQVARAVALPWKVVITLLAPVVLAVQRLTRILTPATAHPKAPEEEVEQLAMISAEEGSILELEADLVQRVLKLNEVRVRDIMTPRTVVQRFPQDITVKEAAAQVGDWVFSRLPLHDPDDPERWTGFVRSQEILVNLARDRFDIRLEDISRPLHLVPEARPVHQVLADFLARRAHIFGVVDEFGASAGVITLEDVIETLLGTEIIDEVDEFADLRAIAKLRARRLRKIREQGEFGAERARGRDEGHGGEGSGAPS
jgi:CBS domain containing-hemolysin-like protein